MKVTSPQVKKFFESKPNIGFEIEQAYGKRRCFQCQEEILKNEWALCQYFTHVHKKFKTRRNICLLCAIPFIEERKESIKKFIAFATQHLTEHPEIKNRKILKSFQDGTHRQSNSWEEL